MRHEWSVVVGNVGTVYHGTSEQAARDDYAEYVHISRRGCGRAAGESVTLLRDGEPVQEYDGVNKR